MLCIMFKQISIQIFPFAQKDQHLKSSRIKILTRMSWLWRTELSNQQDASMQWYNPLRSVNIRESLLNLLRATLLISHQTWDLLAQTIGLFYSSGGVIYEGIGPAHAGSKYTPKTRKYTTLRILRVPAYSVFQGIVFVSCLAQVVSTVSLILPSSY